MTKDAVSFKRESCAERVQWVASWLDFANSSAVPRYRGDFFGSGGSMAQGKERADELVFAQGLAESREMAKRLIMAGKVALEDVSGVRQKVDKPVTNIRWIRPSHWSALRNTSAVARISC